MKLNRLLLFTISISFFTVAHSQTIQKNDHKGSNTSYLDKTEFKVGYIGNVAFNNGLYFGSEYLWKERVKIKEKVDKKGRQKTITHQLLINGNLGFTTNITNKTDTGVFTNYGLIWRRTNTKGKQISIEFNPLGYYRSFLPDTYEVRGDNVSKTSLAGRNYYAPSLSIGIGELREGKKLPGVYFNINLMLRTPYNAGNLPSVFFQYGYRFNCKKKK